MRVQSGVGFGPQQERRAARLFLTLYYRHCLCRDVRCVAVARCTKGGCGNGMWGDCGRLCVAWIMTIFSPGVFSSVMMKRAFRLKPVRETWVMRGLNLWGRSTGERNDAAACRRGIVWPRSRQTPLHYAHFVLYMSSSGCTMLEPNDPTVYAQCS